VYSREIDKTVSKNLDLSLEERLQEFRKAQHQSRCDRRKEQLDNLEIQAKSFGDPLENEAEFRQL
jgi:hypothetical protein